jgi:formyltetrahydrofolate deformylase
MEEHPFIVTLRAPDAAGIIAELARAVAQAGGNISDVGQHSEQGTFACRLEVDPTINPASLQMQLSLLSEEHGWAIEVFEGSEVPKIVIACSKTLHCLSDLLARIAIGEMVCDIAAIVSDQPDGKELADRFNTPFIHIPVGQDRMEQEAQLAATLLDLNPDLVVLARYMRILPASMTQDWEEKMINIHHSFLPAFAGAGPYKRAHERGVKLIGATAHYVTAGLDEGPIIHQEITPVTHRDSSTDLARRGADVERNVLATAVRLHLEHRVMVFGNRTCVFN